MTQHHYTKFTSTNSREEAIQRAHLAGYAVKNVTETAFGNGVAWTAYAYKSENKKGAYFGHDRIIGKKLGKLYPE